MNLALRPYVTTGLAIVGASVIAVSPIAPTPPDVHIPNPVAAVARDVQLAGFVDDTVNQLLFSLVATPTVRISEALLVPLAEALGIDEETAAQLPLASLGLVGPVISGGGATGLAIQNLIDSLGEDNPLEAFTLALINGPALIIDGTVNGGFGPDLAPLVIPLLPALPATIPVGTFNLVTQLPEACVPGPTCLVLTVVPSYGSIFAPGLLTPLGPIPPATELITPPTIKVVNGVPTVVPGELSVLPTLPGFFPVLNQLLDQLFGLLQPADPPADPESTTVETMSVTNTDTTNEKKLVTLDVAPNLGLNALGKDAAANVEQTLSNATEGLTQAGQRLNKATETVTSAVTGATDMRNGFKFEPGTKASTTSGPGGGALTAVSTTISSTAKSLSDAVKSATDAVKSATGLGGEK